MTVDSPQPAVQRLLGSVDPGRETLLDQPGTGPSDGSSSAPRSGGAKARVLATAAHLFYEEGIHSVGVDRLISEASVTKATFYKHYGSKDNLIVAYMNARHDQVVAGMEALIAAAADARAAVRDWVSAIVATTSEPGFRGDAFLNAAAEYHDRRHPIREIVSAHRDWYTERLADLLQEAGHALPGDGADDLMLARDGAMVGAYAGDAIAATAALTRVADRVLSD